MSDELDTSLRGDPHGGHSKRKHCTCGGHNQHNSKKKKGHHSTAARLEHRKGRQGDNLKSISSERT